MLLESIQRSSWSCSFPPLLLLAAADFGMYVEDVRNTAVTHFRFALLELSLLQLICSVDDILNDLVEGIEATTYQGKISSLASSSDTYKL